MKISFVATVFNEEKTIGVLLDSLFKQTKMPDEIVIVDAGSTDNSFSMISEFTSAVRRQRLCRRREESKSLLRQVPDGTWLRHHPRWVNKNIKFKILTKPNSTIAQGRNYGIKKATGDIITMSDAGCVLHKDWLEKVTKPFVKDDSDIVAGFYRMIGTTPLQKALSVYLGIPTKRFDENKFLPSARSMAFKKSLWEKIGGFSEKLDRAGEDTLFNYHAIKFGAKFARVKDALVDWEVPSNLWEGLKKFYIYAKGDVQAGIWWHPTQRISTHNLKIASVFTRYILGFVFFLLAISNTWFMVIFILLIILYFFWAIWKVREIVTDFKTRLFLSITQITSDIAIITGATLGLLKRLWDTQTKQ